MTIVHIIVHYFVDYIVHYNDRMTRPVVKQCPNESPIQLSVKYAFHACYEFYRAAAILCWVQYQSSDGLNTIDSVGSVGTELP